MIWDAPVRDKPPCKDCTRMEGRPECHDHCEQFAKWKAEIQRVNHNRKEYAAKPFSKIM